MTSQSQSRSCSLIFAICLLQLLFCSAALAQLTPQQTRTLATVDANLKQAETNIPLVEQALGNSPTPSATQLRLAASRLGTPQSLLTQLEPMVKTLPANDPAVAPVKARFDAAMKKVADLDRRINNPGASGAAPAAGGAKLDYRQEAELKNAVTYIGEVEGRANAVEAVAKQAETAKDAMDFRVVQQAMNTLTDARQRAKYASDRLAALPQNGAGVADAIAAHKTQLARIDSLEAALKPLNDKLGASVNPGSYPTLEADIKRLGELASMYSDPQILQSRRERAADAIKQSTAAIAEKSRLLTTYASLIQQQTDAGKRLAGSGAYFDEMYGQFNAAAQKLKADFPADLKKDMDETTKLADQAVTEQKPAFFAGGIADRLVQIEEKLALFAALDPTGAEAATRQLADLRTNLKARSNQLKDGIVNANELPPDRYTAADRAQLEQLATDAWKKIQPDAKILKIRIPNQSWQRDTAWRYQNSSWYRIDRSRVQVQLLVQQDDKLAVIRPVDLWKDHMNNDQILAAPMDDLKSELIPQDFVLLGKVK